MDEYALISSNQNEFKYLENLEVISCHVEELKEHDRLIQEFMELFKIGQSKIQGFSYSQNEVALHHLITLGRTSLLYIFHIRFTLEHILTST